MRRLVVILAAALAVAPGSSLANPGALDPTLAHRGIVAEPYGNWDVANAAAVQRDGRIVTVGETELANGKLEMVSTRMLPTGRLDPSYGHNGWVALSIGGTGLGTSLTIMPSGDILLGGAGRSSARAPIAFTAVKLHPDGTVDREFGNQGIATAPIGREALANAIAVQPDGKIVLGGTAYQTHNVFAVARLDADGSVDQTFGSHGTTTLAPDAAAWGMGIAPDGRIVLAGESSNSGSGLTAVLNGLGLGAAARKLSDAGQYMAAAVLPNGQPDPSFGEGGVVKLSIGKTALCTAVAVQADGKVVLAGSAFTNKLLVATARLMPDGSLDSGFGDGGISEQVVEEPVNAVTLQRNGDIVIAATGPTAVRLTPGGAPDTSFGVDGIDQIEHAAGNAANGVTVDRKSGDIVLSGTATLSGRMELSVIRLRGD
jgi:uncharacterized delta-60 repeat protein